MLVDNAAAAALGGIREFSKGIMSVGNYIEKIVHGCARSGLRMASGALKPGHGVSFDCQSAFLSAWAWS